MFRQVLVCGLLLGVSTVQAQTAPKATAELRNTQGKSAGTATLAQTENGVLITVEVKDLPDGPHAIHIHAKGDCAPPSFTSAGGHHAMNDRRHGFHNKQGPHAGDLPNLYVKDGYGKASFMNTNISLLSGEADTILDKDGAAVVIHAGPDDYRTDPAGDSGDRVVCGVLKPEP